MGDSNLGETVTTSELCKAMNEVSLERRRKYLRGQRRLPSKSVSKVLDCTDCKTMPENVVKKLILFNNEFDGKVFYEKYKNAQFLKMKRNITRILSQSDEITTVLNTMAVGEKLVIEGMFIETGTPLIIRKSGSIDQSDVGNDEFTLRRLMGFIAAYVWNNTDAFEGIYASEPEALWLRWTSTPWHRQLYLSAVSGAELFDEFKYLPFLCALKKYTLKKINENMLLYIAKKQHSVTGEPMAVWYRRKFNECEQHNRKFFSPEYSWEMKNLVYKAAPPSVQCYLKNL